MINFKNIETTIEALEQSIAASAYTSEQSKNAFEDFKVLTTTLRERQAPATDDDMQAIQLMSQMTQRHLDEKTLADLKTTLATPLMQATKRYVITDTDELVSPAGFHPDEKVFVQTRVAIHTDTLTNVDVGSDLFVYEVNPA